MPTKVTCQDVIGQLWFTIEHFYPRFYKSGRHLEFLMNDVIHGKIIQVAKMAQTKDLGYEP